MQVIGAGLSRTGTMSTRAALERLGFTCYHMTETPRAPGHLDAWQNYLSGRAEVNWQNLFSAYQATVDLPCCLFYKHLMGAFPTAKVLLNLRDPDNWYNSLVTLSTTLEEFRPLVTQHKRLEQFLFLTDHLGERLTNGDLSRENCITVFERHTADVQSHVPADQLLMFRVQEGWEPLCTFLQCDVPDEPFPHLNEGDDTIRTFIRETLLDR